MAVDRSCAVCQEPTRTVAERTILGRHRAAYDFCPACGFLQVRDPHWLEEAYSSAICAADTGIVMRNRGIAGWLANLCQSLDGGHGPYCDMGGGTGLLVRLMRDLGFDFRWTDPFSDNVFARGFELGAGGQSETQPCTVATAFEVLEHTVDPLAAIRGWLKDAQTGTLVFTTELYSGDPPDDWWYYGTAEGQHIGFFRSDTLERIADILGLRFVSDGGIHVLTDRSDIDRGVIARARSRRGRLTGWLRDRGRSLHDADHAAIIAGLEERHGGR